MKKLFLTFVLGLTTLFSYSQVEGITITITVDNLTSDKGIAAFALHTKETFMRGEGVMNTESTIEAGKVVVTFKNVQPGEYAIIGLHDVNENGRMDYRENGMPLEGFGTSNNVMSFGPPQYDDAKFKVENEDLELYIRF
ncbi:DUF2141 domain-containing protein [Winogradskyella alexanderae]|uniref:DUF2141 domain-containing protein n=1 Tax=Winogradskyella alexanderae TaxID=2877123 RepID=A0ABS7XQM2_9FLAO|nr:DUF2141 domain-containing protein [Winogradskyella alexanderae]MCA0132302.1 DUF2141 domain-containing protein [Winogradskyella alexanderae]